MEDERYCFLIEWYEQIAARTRQFQLSFFKNAKSVEMYDLKNRKLFLRTSLKEDIALQDFYIGNSLNVCGRKLCIVDYGDEWTRKKLSSKIERTLGVIKPDGVKHLGSILDIIFQKGFIVSNLYMCHLSRDQALTFYQEHKSKPFLSSLLEHITSGPMIAFEIVGENAVNVWRETIGPTDPAQACEEALLSIRARFGKDKTYNVVHGSDSQESATRELDFFFPPKGQRMPNTATVQNSTCCIIKPSALKKGLAGKVISAITDAGFKIGAAKVVVLEKANAEEFLEVYKGVVHEYSAMVEELHSGACLVLEILSTKDDQDVVPAFRELAGPADPEIARHLRPTTLRALFGADKVKNAVHCTDLHEDGQLEVEYFFRILDR